MTVAPAWTRSGCASAGSADQEVSFHVQFAATEFDVSLGAALHADNERAGGDGGDWTGIALELTDVDGTWHCLW